MRRTVADGSDADCLPCPAGGGGGDDRAGDAGRDPQHLCRGQPAQYGAGAVGGGGLRRRGLGPLVGGMLLEHFYWGSVFLINVPIVLVVIAINAKVVPRQPARRDQPLNLLQALILIAAILMLVFSAKSALKGQLALWLTALVAIGGAAMLTWFIRKQLSAVRRWWICDCSLIALFKRGDDGDDRPDYPGGF